MTDSDSLTDRARELGQARIDLARTFRSAEDWKERWPAPARPFPFALAHWRHCICYCVDDYAAEAGFFLDILGLPAPMFGPDNALLTDPEGTFAFQIAAPDEGEEATPAETITLMFYVDNLLEACADLETRGIVFTEPPAPMGGPESTFYSAEFRTPHGVPVAIWGVVGKPPEA